MKKIFLITACLLLAACDSYINVTLYEFHEAAAITCEKNGGWKSLMPWNGSNLPGNQRLAIVCNDLAEFHIYRTSIFQEGETEWSEWKPDHSRFGEF